MQGLTISKGIALGKSVYLKPFSWPVEAYEEQVALSLEKLEASIRLAVESLKDIHDKLEKEGRQDQASIINMHQSLIEDEEFIDRIKEILEKHGYTPAYAVKCATDEFVDMFNAMENTYFRERAHDLLDVGKRLIRQIQGEVDIAIEDLPKGSIIIAEDLVPSETARINQENVIGFVTKIGGKTSHTAIIANMLGIPAISAIDVDHLVQICDRNKAINIILDGHDGTVVVNPSEEQIKTYETALQKIIEDKERLNSFLDKKAVSEDGHAVKVTANILLPGHGKVAAQVGSDGIGLFRSEFLFMESKTAPTEDMQFEAYKEVAEAMGDKQVIIRTLDVGGDKEVEYLGIEKEMNPFLGYRAIRYCLDHPYFFKNQLKAILRAGHYGNLAIMFPMISSLEELISAKRLVQEAKSELKAKSIPYDEHMKVGVMIEVPSAALISDQLAKACDFFSIGTNDLIQYTTASDRMNSKVERLYNPMNLGVLRLIEMTIKNGHAAGIEVGMCGSTAADEALIPIYLGMGLDKFSVNPRDVLKTKAEISALNYKQVQEQAQKVLYPR